MSALSQPRLGHTLGHFSALRFSAAARSASRCLAVSSGASFSCFDRPTIMEW